VDIPTVTLAACPPTCPPAACPAAALNSSDIKEAKDVFMKALNRMALFGAMPPSILPALVSVRTKVDLPKTADRKLLRLVNYMIQISAGEGSAGTVVPFSTLLGKQQAAALHLVVDCAH
jgi:hypothetical protein